MPPSSVPNNDSHNSPIPSGLPQNPASPAELYDVFLSHAHVDATIVERLAVQLTDRQLKPWLDRWVLVPGELWQQDMAKALTRAKTCVVCIGNKTPLGWFQQEIQRALNRQTQDPTFRVIPVILPGGDQSLVDNFLELRTWVDFRSGMDDKEALHRLVSGILGKAPGRFIADTPAPQPTPVPFLVPHPRSRIFTGRDNLLATLHQTLLAHPAAALTGFGGLGKTQTAVEYAFRHRPHYTAVFWLPASSRETLLGAFAKLAAELHLPAANQPDQQLAVADLHRWLEAHPGALLIFDNADDLSFLPPFLPTDDATRLLLTTQVAATSSLAIPLAVRPLSSEDGALLILRRADLLQPNQPPPPASNLNFRAALSLAQELGNLPLALDQAGAYIATARRTVAHYAALYAKEQATLLGQRGPLADHASVSVTFRLAFTRLTATSPAAADLLRLCAFLDADDIPEELFTAADSTILGETLATATQDPLAFDNLFFATNNLSLLDRNPDNSTLTIHRLLQDFLKTEMSPEDQRTWADRTVRAVAKIFPDSDYANWPSCQRLIAHAQTCATLIEQWELDSEEAANLLNRAAGYLTRRALFGEAEPLCKHSLAILEKLRGPDHNDVGTVLNNLGYLYDEQGNYTEAEPLYQRALTIWEKALGPDHPDVATSLNNIAQLCSNQGKYTEAEPLHQRALTIRERALGPDHSDVATSLNNLASLYHNQGKYNEAEPLYLCALTIFEKALGPNHPDVAQSLNNLASLYSDQGKNTEAELLYQRALTIKERALGPDHPDVALSLNNIGLLYSNQGNYTEAEPLHRRALTIREKALGPNHPDVAFSHNNLATLYYHQGKYTEAEPLFRRALTIWEIALGPNHPNVATSLNNLAQLYSNQGNYTEAEPLYKRALTIWEKVLGPDHPDVALALSNLADLYKAQNRSAEAAPLRQRAQIIRQKTPTLTR